MSPSVPGEVVDDDALCSVVATPMSLTTTATPPYRDNTGSSVGLSSTSPTSSDRWTPRDGKKRGGGRDMQLFHEVMQDKEDRGRRDSGSARPGEARKESKSSHARGTAYIEDPLTIFNKFLRNKCGSVIKAWFHYFDKNQNRHVDLVEFHTGLTALNYPGSIDGLWDDIIKDPQEIPDLMLEEVEPAEAMLWNEFRSWAGKLFSGPRDMIRQVKQAAKMNESHRKEGSGRRASLDKIEVLTESEFAEGLAALGWEHGYESLLFGALDIDGDGVLSTLQFKWLEIEVRRNKQKEVARRKAQRVQEQKAHGKQVCQAALLDFKAMLRKQFGPTFRAWRRVLDSDGSMSVQRADLFKVCRQLNWKGDVRALWKALDHDGSNVTNLEELDAHCAQLLANFKLWAVKTWGLKPAAAMFRDLDKQRARKVRYAQFVHECQQHGFDRKVKTLAVWLDWQDKKYLVEEDFHFFDTWKPPAYLSASASPEAAEEFKAAMLAKCGHYLKAWRTVMDKDNSNCCNWHEFQEAAKLIKFHGDIAGAWLAFDQDLSGYITLKEIDSASHEALVEFKLWADSEFGSVRAAYKVLDADNNDLSFREFNAACRNYGFQGDPRSLFNALDQANPPERILQYKEVVFLDDWDICPAVTTTEGVVDPQEALEKPEEPVGIAKNMLEYQTPVPGPGAYDVLSGFGATPLMPCTKHAGAWSFTNRRPWPRLQRTVGPARYDPSLKPTITSKPSWSFGDPRRLLRERRSTGQGRRTMWCAESMESPGPGAYDLRATFHGPKFSMRPRRGMVVHPGQKPPAVRGEQSGYDSAGSRPFTR
mmetsp:Transcript_81373/g.140933  ORF Transcript_81373/g.140933 Transcript_81373/m.140933 type:complete len:816 (+) Transcript_81373:53-2500(+)